MFPAGNAQTIIPLLTELMKRHGYSNISDLCKQAKGDRHVLRQLLKPLVKTTTQQSLRGD